MHGSPEYIAWQAMIVRCTDESNPGWPRYGGRGIRVCDEWLCDFTAFFRHVGPRPHGMSIDRIDNDGNYEPGNVRWATRQEQSANQRSNVWIEANGHRRTVAEWARSIGLSDQALRSRLASGWDPTHAVTTPPMPRGQRYRAA